MPRFARRVLPPLAVAALVLALGAAAAAAPRFDPADGAAGVSRLAQPALQWPDAPGLRDADLNADTLSLRTAIGTEVPGTVMRSGDDAAFIPRVPLVGCATYTLALRLPGKATASSRFTTACSEWQPPEQVDDRRTARRVDVPADGPVITESAGGSPVAAWFQDDHDRRAIWASRLNPDTGAWSAPRVIDNAGGPGAGSSIPALAATGSGEVLATWMQAVHGHTGIFLGTRDAATGKWSAPRRLDDPTLRADAANPQIAVAPDGRAVVAWQQRQKGHMRVFASARGGQAGTWSPPQALSAGEAFAYAPAVAVVPGGPLLAAWEQGLGASSAVFSSALPDGESRWSRARQRSVGREPAVRPAWAVGGGKVMLGWLQGGAAVSRLMVTSGATSGKPAVALSPAEASGPATSFSLVADAAGNVTAVWAQSLQRGASASAGMFAARRSGSAPQWSTPVRLDKPDWRTPGNPVTVVDPAGTVTAAWYQDGPRGLQVEAARFDPASQRWSAARTVSDPHMTATASFPALAVSAAGSVTAVWQQFNGWRSVIAASMLP